MKKIVLLIDSDLGFVFWLGRILAELGCEAFPAKSVPDALDLLREFQLSVSLLIVRNSLPCVAALIEQLRGLENDLKVILAIEDGDRELVWPADAEFWRPDRIDENSKVEWLQVVQKVLWNDPVAMSGTPQRYS